MDSPRKGNYTDMNVIFARAYPMNSVVSHLTRLRFRLTRPLTLISICRTLMLCSVVAIPLKSFSQTCATQPSSSSPPPIYRCDGGVCSNWEPPYTIACPNGSVNQLTECSAANYNSYLYQYFGTLTFTGDVPQPPNEALIQWSAQLRPGVVYQSVVVLVTPTQVCPLYWVAAPPPVQAETSSKNHAGDPVNPAIGNVYTTEQDVAFAGSGAIAYRRFYNSADLAGIDGVPGWRHSYGRLINTIYETASSLYSGSSANVSSQYTTPAVACTTGFAAIQASVSAWASATASYTNGVCVLSKSGATIGTLPVQSYPIPLPPTTPVEYDVIRDDGQTLRYTMQNGAVNNPPGVSIRLAVTGSGFTVTDDQDNVETYNSAGVLQSITDRAGIEQTLSYSGGLWSGVTDSFGNALTVTRNAQGSIATIAITGAGTLHYGYDSALRLSTVTNLDSTTKSYVYADGRFANALTSIVDESSTTLTTWVYNAQEQATSTHQAAAANAQTLVYNSTGSVTITDALGAVRTFSYSRVGDINKVTSISGSQCATCQESAATTYDTAGWVASRTDYNGNLTCYANDPVRGLELVRVEGFAPGSTCPTSLSTYMPQSGTLQRMITTQWSTTWRQPSLIAEPNRTIGFTFDSFGNVLTKTITDTTVTPSVSRTWTYTYNSYGQVLTIDGPRTDVSDVTTIAYYTCSTGTQCGQIETITNALGQITTFNTYNAYGQPLTITDPNGVLTTLTYDARQRLTSSQVGTEITGYSCWPIGLLKTVTLPDSSTITYTYDAAHRLTKITDSAGNYISYTLDALGNRTADNTYDPTSTLRRTHTRIFNTLNQLYQDINAAGTGAVTTTLGYDAQGNQTSIDAPLSRNTGKSFDALNRLSQITDPNGGFTLLDYDANDNVASVKDPRNFITSYAHNGFNDLAMIASPDTGTTINTYDSGGNLKTSIDSRSAAATYSYDALNRVTQVAYTDQTINFTYDAGTNGVGRLTGASDANHSMSWIYDGLGRVTGKGQTISTVTKSVGYAFTNGDLTSLLTPSGQTVTYGYTNHRIASVSVNGTTILSGATYDPFGPANAWTWGNATTVSRTFDEDGNPAHIVTAAVTNTYTVDNASRITGVSDSGLASNSWTFGYDLLDRVNAGTSTALTRGYTYDANSNRLTTTGTTASTEPVSAANNQLNATSGGIVRSYSYDNAGNALSFTGETFTFNQRGRMSSATNSAGATNYLYSALGQLIEKSGSGGTTLVMYDEAGHLLGEYTSTGALIQETIWMGDIPVATLQPNGSGISIYYVHTDHLGTPRKITRPSDNGLMWRWDPDTFGSVNPNTNPSGLGAFNYNLRFPGQYSMNESGLFYNYFRDYDPTMGRYIESDPIGLKAGINTYAYVSGNPLSNIDPLGLDDSICSFNPVMCNMPAPSADASLPDGMVNALAGIGDSALLNIPSYIRNAAGWDKEVDKCSLEYRAGSWFPLLLGAGRLAYAGLAKGFSIFAASGAEASAARTSLRQAFGGGPTLRPPNLTQYSEDAALRAAAGRTNPLVNAAGAAAAGTGGANASGCGCSK
jgi:RHS repeat-associated protein